MDSIVTDRLSWDKTWLAVAEVVAQRSRCVRDQVGAVIVSPRNRVVATGYNGPPAGFRVPVQLAYEPRANERDCHLFCPRAMHGPTENTVVSYTDCVSNHAEANALSVADRSTFEGGTLYVSSDVCQLCAKLVANSGLKRVVAARKRGRDYRVSELGYDFLDQCGLVVHIVEQDPPHKDRDDPSYCESCGGACREVDP